MSLPHQELQEGSQQQGFQEDSHQQEGFHPSQEGSQKITVNLVNLEGEEVKCDDKQEVNCEQISGKKSSPAWDYFERIKGCPVGKEKAKCKLCNIIIGCCSRNGTSAMMNHLKTVCPKSPLRTNLDKLQKTLRFEKIAKEDKFHTIKAHTFNQERLRKKLALMCIKDNQPFKIVEHEGFKELMNEAEPKFKMPSRWTVARDCLKIYGEELVKLKMCLASQRVSFTTDTWTSIQNTNYMCLTAHWINDDWKMCKRILNFVQIGSHKGVAIGKMLLDLFAQWGIDRVFTITLDNASSNDKAIMHLKTFLRGPEAILENKFLHMRCCAHILNLVVKDGLREQHDSIARIRNATRYVRSSPARLEKFRRCVEKEKIKCNKMVCLDVDTRWNSTYTMLEVAVKYERAFTRMYIEDTDYETFFKVADLEVIGESSKKKKKKVVEGAPLYNDFANVNRFIQFLEFFYDVTMKLSGSKYCTSNVFFVELVKVQEAIIKLCSSEDILMRDMAKRMKDKYDKYWDNVENTNFLLYVAVVLDPRYKMSYIEFCFAKIYGRGSTKNVIMCDKVMKTLQEFFDYYMNLKGHQNSSKIKTNQLDDSWEEDFEKYMEDKDNGGIGKSELDVYLVDTRERKSEGFDILGWWKVNSIRFPILSEIAKHVLGMPVSSVASEAAFSTGGRTIDAYRSSLSPKTAEALVCSQDWLRSSETVIDLRGEPEEYLQLEKLENDELQVVGKSFEHLDISD